MHISPVSPYSDPVSRFTETKRGKEKDAVKSEEKLDFTRMMNERLFSFYNQKGQVSSNESASVRQDDPQEIENRESIRKQIWQQTYALLQEGYTKSYNQLYDDKGRVNSDPFGVDAYFSENPEDWKKVQMGIVPDYFNTENTGQRILDIWVPEGTESLDADSVENAEKNILKAYAEVADMFGGSLPQLVLDTKDYVIEKLHSMITVNTES